VPAANFSPGPLYFKTTRRKAMKRTVLSLLILSLIALPTFAGSTSAHKATLTGARCLSLAHDARGWRMEIKCDQNKGAIVMLDSGQQVQYVGEGIFRGWSPAELKAAYQSLIPKTDVTFEVMQLG
jgi:hypothetical protein